MFKSSIMYPNANVFGKKKFGICWEFFFKYSLSIFIEIQLPLILKYAIFLDFLITLPFYSSSWCTRAQNVGNRLVNKENKRPNVHRTQFMQDFAINRVTIYRCNRKISKIKLKHKEKFITLQFFFDKGYILLVIVPQ